jgi:hypothetical protein
MSYGEAAQLIVVLFCVALALFLLAREAVASGIQLAEQRKDAARQQGKRP